MPQMIPMVATVAFDRNNGDKVKAGDRISVPPLEAAALSYGKKARFVNGAAPKEQTLQRRDMEAETPGTPSAPASSSSSSSPSDSDTTGEPTRSRRHRNRAMEAGG